MQPSFAYSFTNDCRTNLRYVIQCADSGFLCTGKKIFMIPNPYKYIIYIIRTDKNGDLLWEKSYGDYSRDGGNYITQSHDSGFIIGSKSNGNSYLLKISEQGDSICMKNSWSNNEYEHSYRHFLNDEQI